MNNILEFFSLERKRKYVESQLYKSLIVETTYFWGKNNKNQFKHIEILIRFGTLTKTKRINVNDY